MKTLIIIPTYNERENIGKLIPLALEQSEGLEILVVDDNSPDGTAQVVQGICQTDDRVHLLSREGKMGLGTAYVAGFKYALEKDYEAVMEMDADFSHDAKEIPNFIAAAAEADVVQGSRYCRGVNVINWSMGRLLLSYFANYYTRLVTGLPVMDGTGGFRLIKAAALRTIDLDRIRSNGYSFQIELLYKIWKKGFTIKEIPIIFYERVQGKSKMSKKIVYEAIFMVWKLRLKSLFRRL